MKKAFRQLADLSAHLASLRHLQVCKASDGFCFCITHESKQMGNALIDVARLIGIFYLQQMFY